jgi:hypothetical protein
MTGPALTCPACGSADFVLQLGGRASGRTGCGGCGLTLDPGAAPAPGRERCVYCWQPAYEPGWGCHGCGMASLGDVSGSLA